MKIIRYFQSTTLIALLATTLMACHDDEFSGVTTSDEISFAVDTGDWQELTRSSSRGYEVKDAMRELDEKCGKNGKIYVHSEPTTPLSDSTATRASAVSTTDLQTSGFNVYAVVKEKSSGAESLLMNDNPLTYSGGKWTYSPTKYWPSTEQYTTTFYGYIPSQFKYIDNPYSTIVPEGVYTVPVDPTQQKDIIAARYTKNDRQTVNLAFEHLLTTVKLRFRNVRSAVTKVEISGVYDSANFKMYDWVWGSHRNSGENPNGVFSYTFLPTQFVAYEPGGYKYLLDANGQESYFMMIPQTISDNARLLITFENGTKVDTPLKMKDSGGNYVDWEPGKTVTYTIDYTDIHIIYLTDSNCYLINPNNTSNNPTGTEYWYAIPISWRINTFWQNEAGIKPLVNGFHYAAVVLWQDEPNQVIEFVNTDKYQPNYFDKYVDSENEYVYFKLKYPETILPDPYTNPAPKHSPYCPSNTCNIVIGVRSVDDYNYLWSWHLWLSRYSTQPVQALPGDRDYWALFTYNNIGHILRYGEAKGLPDNLKMWSNRYKDKYVMDRNIGAGSSEIIQGATGKNLYWETFGMYYQWGRKDPFPPNGKIYDINGIEQGEIFDNQSNISGGPFKLEMAQVNMTYAVNNPCTFFGYNEDNKAWMPNVALRDNWNNPDWYEPGKGNGKSFYDPSPPGWQVPAPGIWDVFQKGQTYDGTLNAGTGQPAFFYENRIIALGEDGAFCRTKLATTGDGVAGDGTVSNGDLLGFGFFRNLDNSSDGNLIDCTTDYAYWGLRNCSNGYLWFNARNNSGVWTCAKEGDGINCFFFQYLHMYPDEIIKLRGVALTQWGIQVRCIHQ